MPLTGNARGDPESEATGVKRIGVVRQFDAEEGVGIIDSPDVPGGCFLHCSDIAVSGFHVVRAGQRVWFTFETPGFDQAGCPHPSFVIHPWISSWIHGHAADDRCSRSS